MSSDATFGWMAGAKSFQEQIDEIWGAFRTLTDGVWNWRDPKALALLLTRFGTLLLAALAYLTVAGVIPPVEDVDPEVAEPADVIDVEAVESEGSTEQ